MWLACLALAATLVAYWPALQGGFVFDDANWTTDLVRWFQNPAGLWAIWVHPTLLQQYYPLTATSFWLDYQLWDFWTVPYHLENVLLHILAAVLLWGLLAPAARCRARAWRRPVRPSPGHGPNPSPGSPNARTCCRWCVWARCWRICVTRRRSEGKEERKKPPHPESGNIEHRTSNAEHRMKRPGRMLHASRFTPHVIIGWLWFCSWGRCWPRARLAHCRRSFCCWLGGGGAAWVGRRTYCRRCRSSPSRGPVRCDCLAGEERRWAPKARTLR